MSPIERISHVFTSDENTQGVMSQGEIGAVIAFFIVIAICGLILCVAEAREQRRQRKIFEDIDRTRQQFDRRYLP